jgi:DNA gyrase/topoisomerase IV subunit B
MADKKLTYDSSSIQVLSGLDGIRGNPTMYVGSTDEHGLFLILRELMDNAVDEFLAKRANTLRVYLPTAKQLKAGEAGYWVHDNGQGVPQGTKTMVVHVNGKDVNSKMPTMQAIFGTMHASGKHSSAYANSIGTHGIGAKGTNALSKIFQVWTRFEGTWYHIEFKKGKLTSGGVIKQKPPRNSPFGVLQEGTVIYFEPDQTMFSKKSFPASMAENWAQMTAYMNPRFRIIIAGEAGEREFYSKNGPKDYLDDRLQVLKTQAISKSMFESQDADHDVVVAFTDYGACDLRGFTNGLYNEEGGTHISAVQDALFKTVKEYAKKKQVFTAYDFREGLVGVVNAKLSGAKFSSQAKVKLVDERMGEEFEQRMTKIAAKFWSDNKTLAVRICERSAKLNELKNSFKLNKKALQEVTKAAKRMPAKFCPAHKSTKPEDLELFLVEGESASGPAKVAKYSHQAVLPLKGKPLNSLRDKSSKVLESPETANILAAARFDPKSNDPYSKIKGKIICLADPDTDGPFIAGTQILALIEGETDPRLVPIEELVGVKFMVKTWNRNRTIWADAVAGQVKTTTQIVAMEVEGTKYKVDPDHKWAVKNYKPWEVSEGTVVLDQTHNIAWKRARDITSGDWIFKPLEPGAPRKAKDHAIVSKCKTQELKEAVPVFCLSVPSTGNFLTPAGHVSSNCHINVLLLGLFFKFLPRLFETGQIYVAAAPEFYAKHKGQIISGDTLSEVQDKFKKQGIPMSTPIRHIKGWGEINADEMRLFAMNKETRNLIRIKPLTDEDKDLFTKLMGDDVQYRKQLLGV